LGEKKLVNLTVDDGVAIIIIDNPPLNVLNKEVVACLNSCLEEIEKDKTIVSVVVTGTGERAFMAGADIKEFLELNAPGEAAELSNNNHWVFSRLADLPQPTIAALNGLAYGGGCELTLCCDLRVAEEDVKIALPEINLGLFPGGGGTQRLSRLIGSSRAKEMMFFGEPLGAQEALKLGLVNKVVSKGEALNKSVELAKKLTTKAGKALQAIKQAVDQGTEQSIANGLTLEIKLFDNVFQTEDVKEGVNAFLEKRGANFKHR